MSVSYHSTMDKRAAEVRIQCGFCSKWITKSNMARHKKKHGELVCQRCALKIGEIQRVIDHSHQQWFAMFQDGLAADEILAHMHLYFDSNLDYSEKELMSQYIATLLDLQYYHISMDPIRFQHIFRLVLEKMKII